MDSQARREVQLQGPKPAALMVNRNSTKIKKQQHRLPVIVHLRSPKVIHVRPEEFMGLVQHLTGNPVSAPPAAACCPDHTGASTMILKATPQEMEKRSPVIAMDQSQEEDFMGGVEPRDLSLDFHALLHFVDFV